MSATTDQSPAEASKRLQKPYASVLDLIGNTPLVELTRFDTGPCRLFLKLESAEPRRLDQGPHRRVDDRGRRARRPPASPAAPSSRPPPATPAWAWRWSARARATGSCWSCPTRCRARRSCTCRRWAPRCASRAPTSARATPSTTRTWPSDRGRASPGSFYVNQFDNPANPLAHETTTGPEIWEQMDGDVDAIVVGVGSGGTLTGLGRFFARRSPKTEMVLADPVGSILAPLVKTGEMGEAGSWAVEGIGEDFVPAHRRPLAGEQGLRDLRRRELRDRARLLLREGRHPRRLVVRHAAGRGAALLPRADRAEARRHLRLRHRHELPVARSTTTTGWSTRACSTRELHGDLRDLIARAHARAATVTVGPDDTLLTAFQPHARSPTCRSCRCIDDGRLVGLIDECDLLRASRADDRRRRVSTQPVSDGDDRASSHTLQADAAARRAAAVFDRDQVAIVMDGERVPRPDHPHRPDQPSDARETR